jgi:hypothetical protein
LLRRWTSTCTRSSGRPVASVRRGASTLPRESSLPRGAVESALTGWPCTSRSKTSTSDPADRAILCCRQPPPATEVRRWLEWDAATGTRVITPLASGSLSAACAHANAAVRNVPQK